MYSCFFKKCSILFIGTIMLLLSFNVSAFAETVNKEADATEVVFTAEVPLDFDRVIVITATSLDTGFIHSYYLNPESNYKSYELVPYGKYSITTSVAPATDNTDDGTIYIAKPSTEIFIVKQVSYTLGLSVTVEGYTNTTQEELPNEENPSTEPAEPTDPDTSINTSPVVPDISTPEPDPESDNDGVAAPKTDNSNIKRSFFSSILVILIFLVCGALYRKHKEG